LITFNLARPILATFIDLLFVVKFFIAIYDVDRDRDRVIKYQFLVNLFKMYSMVYDDVRMPILFNDIKC
jgi:hypothetical protein